MFEFIKKFSGYGIKHQRDKAHEAALRKALAEKISHYRETPSAEDTEYTQVTIGERTLRVEAQHITLTDISA